MFTLKPKLQTGFTLIELAIVIAILGVLAAIIAPRLASTRQDANTSAVRTDLASLNTASVRYQLKNGGAMPASVDILVTDKYLDKVPNNPLRSNSDEAVAVGVPTTETDDVGWYYDSATGVFTASGCDGISYNGTGVLGC